MDKILHQLIDGLSHYYPITYRVSKLIMAIDTYQPVQDGLSIRMFAELWGPHLVILQTIIYTFPEKDMTPHFWRLSPKNQP